ncbi:CGNR zinc finger domain-containing protein [Microbacterium sp. zg-YB36]|uniref:CGNR zinc finger domain-containing protein n=1 Tax=Microbacterium sp. zg-YB36 TaxID=2969407 RepID=UPI00214B8C65|nr:CGNR zinc finger domain-containing protein [Microbacterium sp. zg-YB36]MDL5350105.1 CGNR zinc finger domain-containing protein [Microbacterium sp. zg-YB36]
MLFARDTTLALAAAVDLVNTMPETDVDGADRLETREDLQRFLAVHPYTGSFTHDQREVDAVRGIRPRLRALWLTDRAGAVPLVNAMLRDGHALPQLVIHEGYDWHIHAAGDEAPFATRILVETAMAFVDIIRSDAYERVRECSADDCLSVYIDYSKNGSKRYCDTGNCGNRMNVNAYRRRKAAESA